MANKRCSFGHVYDDVKYSRCPHCGINIGGSTQGTDPTELYNSGTYGGPSIGTEPGTDPGGSFGTQKTNPAAQGGGGQQDATDTHQYGQYRGEAKKGEPDTIGIPNLTLGMDPVVGWLVCVEGPEKGRDYRIKSERNFIGRASKMDICIHDDHTISREEHAIISYNPRNKSFLLIPGSGRSIVYVNDSELTAALNLNAYDTIEMGRSKFLFIPFCGPKFNWEAGAAGAAGAASKGPNLAKS